ncbi:MAG TPA: alpha/beta fold hydrolase [Micromonosporaceae bacterium]|jgi:esterase/lipase|nr:alpha/beta fold hydrolase [Micromonosporaceae bacterium]
MTPRVDYLMSATLFLSPQLTDDRIYFISDLSGRLSLWAMDAGGSVPERILPADVAMMTPELLGGESFVALPGLGKIIVMLDKNGDENMQPCVVPLSGGDPEPLFGDRFTGQQVNLVALDPDGRGRLFVDPRTRPELEAYEFDLTQPGGGLNLLGSSKYGYFPSGRDESGDRFVIVDQYLPRDTTLWLWERATGQRRLLRGTPIEDRTGAEPPLREGMGNGWFVGDDGLLVESFAFDDLGGLAWLSLAAPDQLSPVAITGLRHSGRGEFTDARHLAGDRYALSYNVDGVSWGYGARFDAATGRMSVEDVLFGAGALGNGVVSHFHYDEDTDRYAVAYSSAATPAQLAVLGAPDGAGVRTATLVTRNRVVGVDPDMLGAGEDASFTSHDGLRVSARLYLPSDGLGYVGPRPVVYYIHGGPQGQERPDFTWFSMPLIQYLTLRGFAVFVPNARGSTGYGQDYMSRVDRDWGGQDRLDHVAGVAHLRKDSRLDADRIGVMGRSYGGFMTLTLAGRHPELWSAAIDMFGPYDLPVWVTRLPEAWQTYFHLALGHPDRDRDELVARSPRTYLHDLACPMMVIQGANDPRVTKADSDDLVDELRGKGKQIDYLVFEDEGHDVTKTVNKVRCYEAITNFMAAQLHPGEAGEMG